jgi:hypothetical protein
MLLENILIYKTTLFHITERNHLNIVQFRNESRSDRESPSTIGTRLCHFSCRQPYKRKFLLAYDYREYVETRMHFK